MNDMNGLVCNVASTGYANDKVSKILQETDNKTEAFLMLGIMADLLIIDLMRLTLNMAGASPTTQDKREIAQLKLQRQEQAAMYNIEEPISLLGWSLEACRLSVPEGYRDKIDWRERWNWRVGYFGHLYAYPTQRMVLIGDDDYTWEECNV